MFGFLFKFLYPKYLNKLLYHNIDFYPSIRAMYLFSNASIE